MSQKTALIVAMMVTSFVLVAAGGVTATFANRQVVTPEPVVATDVPTVVPPTPTTVVNGVDPAVVAQREIAYQKQIAEANAQLQRAYFLQKALADELANSKPTATPKPRVYVLAAAPVVQPTKAPLAVSAEQAGQLALAAVPGSTLTATPELVLFQGTVAYEVTLDWGKVYIDANTGAVLYNGTTIPAPPSTNVDNGGSSGSGGQPSASQPHNDDGGNEHQGGGDDGGDD